MKKYLILLIIPLLFFSTGCEEDSTIEEITLVSNLDSNLYGVWRECYSNGTDDTCQYNCDYWVFSSNGQYSHFQDDVGDDIYEYGQGSWYVEGNVLITSMNGSQFYSVDGDVFYTDGEKVANYNDIRYYCKQ